MEVVENFILPISSTDFIWSKWVPEKVNLFKYWQASKNLIPVKFSFKDRGIIPDAQCTSCGFHSETTDHALVNCNLAYHAWCAISYRIGVTLRGYYYLCKGSSYFYEFVAVNK